MSVENDLDSAITTILDSADRNLAAKRGNNLKTMDDLIAKAHDHIGDGFVAVNYEIIKHSGNAGSKVANKYIVTTMLSSGAGTTPQEAWDDFMECEARQKERMRVFAEEGARLWAGMREAA